MTRQFLVEQARHVLDIAIATGPAAGLLLLNLTLLDVGLTLQRDETLRRQFQRAQALAFPNGHPQEREVGFVWFSNHYGPALVDRLLDELPLEMGYHWILSI